MFTVFDKAITAFIMPAITQALLGAFGGIGVTGSTTVSTIITMVVTAFFTWLVPNAKKA